MRYLALISLLWSDFSFGLNPHADFGFGHYVMRDPGESGLWLDHGLLGGLHSIETNPPGSLHLERRYEALARWGLATTWGLWGELRFAGLKARAWEQGAGDYWLGTAAQVQALLGYGWRLGFLELHLGLDARVQEGRRDFFAGGTRVFQLFTQRQNLWTYKLALVRRASSWVGGLYYGAAETAPLALRRVANQTVGLQGRWHLPMEFGLVGEFTYGDLLIGADLAQVFAAGGGSSLGRDDYLRLRFKVWGSGWGLKVLHDTLSYADHLHASADSIPRFAVELLWLPGSWRLGLFAAVGIDKSNITEIRTEIRHQAVGLTLAYDG